MTTREKKLLGVRMDELLADIRASRDTGKFAAVIARHGIDKRVHPRVSKEVLDARVHVHEFGDFPCSPLQFERAVRHVALTKGPDDLLFVGETSTLVVYLAELLCPRARCCVLSQNALPNALLAYSRYRHFACTCIAYNCERFMETVGGSVTPQQIAAVCPAPQDDLNALLALVDVLLTRRCRVLLFNADDPMFPNANKVWRLCAQNKDLSCTLFDDAYDVPVKGGGIGIVTVLKDRDRPEGS